MTPQEAFETLDKWDPDTTYGQDRRYLLDWLIDYMESWNRTLGNQGVVLEAIRDLSILLLTGPHNPREGVCSHLGRGYTIPTILGPFWPEFSGDIVFPVPASRLFGEVVRMDHRKQYASRRLWTKLTRYGRARWRFTEWLLDELTAHAERESWL